MRRRLLFLLATLTVAGCDPSTPGAADSAPASPPLTRPATASASAVNEPAERVAVTGDFAARLAAEVTAPVRASAPGVTSDLPAGSPLGAIDPLAMTPREATVLERLEAGPYSYLRVRLASSGEHAWVATMGEGAGAGAQVRIIPFGEKNGFYSRRLDRTFDRVVFATVSPTDP